MTDLHEIPTPPPAGPGPVIALIFRSVAEHVAGHPYGVYQLPDVAEAAAAMIEVVESQLTAAEMATAEQPGQYYARRLLGRLGPNEPVYVQVGELAEHVALPAHGGRPAVGVVWDPRLAAAPAPPGLPGQAGWEECARHAVENLPRTLGLLDVATLGLVLYDEVACATCVAEHQVEVCPGSDELAPAGVMYGAVDRAQCDDCGRYVPLHDPLHITAGGRARFARHSRLVDEAARAEQDDGYVHPEDTWAPDDPDFPSDGEVDHG